MANITDKDIMEVLLTQHKLGAISLTNLVLESSCQNVRTDATNLLTKTFEHQKQIYDIMSQKGWYQTMTASPQEISNVQTSLNM
ncbi:MAG TPA: spore coat protein [Clostridiaceae bacterium]|nr:spore coat protein [Clostridiaceae bacterium]